VEFFLSQVNSNSIQGQQLFKIVMDLFSSYDLTSINWVSLSSDLIIHMKTNYPVITEKGISVAIDEAGATAALFPNLYYCSYYLFPYSPFVIISFHFYCFSFF